MFTKMIDMLKERRERIVNTIAYLEHQIDMLSGYEDEAYFETLDMPFYAQSSTTLSANFYQIIRLKTAVKTLKGDWCFFILKLLKVN